jgi:hypothetical protein
MFKPKFYGLVNQDGKLILDHRPAFDGYVKQLMGKRVELTIAKESQDVTGEQMAYYYACIVRPLALDLGYLEDEMDWELKNRFLRVKGNKMVYTRNKTDLNREELAAFIDKCIVFAAEQGVVVVPPNKLWSKI